MEAPTRYYTSDRCYRGINSSDNNICGSERTHISYPPGCREYTPVPFAAITAEVIFPFAASAIVTAARHSTNNKNKKKPPEGRNGGAGDDKENTEDEILGTR